MIKKSYYTLNEVASNLHLKQEDLIHLGVRGEIPIYVLADNWHVHLWAKIIEQSVTSTGQVTQMPYEEICKSHIASSRILNGPARLNIETLSRYEANPDVLINTFEADAPDDEETLREFIKALDAEGYVDEEIPRFIVNYEYRLVRPDNPMQATEVSLRGCRLVLLAEDFKLLKKRLNVDLLDKPLGEKEKISLLKLVIGMAIGRYSYDPLKPKNPAISEISSDLEVYGVALDPDTIRKWLGEAAKLVLSGKPNKP